MYKKLVILGMVLLLAGAGSFSWVRLEQKKAKHLVQERLDTINNRVIELSKPVLSDMGLGFLDKLVTKKPIVDESDAGFFNDVVSEKGLEQELAKYESRKAMREHMYLASLSLMSIGGTVSTWCLLVWIIRLSGSGISRWKGASARRRARQDQGRDDQLTTACADEHGDACENEQQQQQNGSEKHSQVLSRSGWQSGPGHSTSRRHNVRSKRELLANRSSRCRGPAKELERIAELYSDEGRSEGNGAASVENASLDPGAAPLDELTKNIRSAILSEYHQNTAKLEDSLKSQTENLQRQIAEFRQITQSVQQAAIQQSKPLDNSLDELTQQISAIRDYAAHQQEKVQKLQDGYDWKIIRAFCLRIIRCIDNLEKRIEDLSGEDADTTSLKETRDELLFALESSNVEQFKPEINSRYSGQEKTAEVVKERQNCENGDMKGKIAKVLRPGYRYIIDENNVKVVRAAQVKLYA